MSQIYLFQSWPIKRIEHCLQYLGENDFKEGQILYEQGDEAHSFFLVKEGSFKIEMAVDYKNFNKYPITNRKWEVLITTKRILHTIKHIGNVYLINLLGPYEFFGHEEILTQTPRITRVTALQDSIVLYLNKDNFAKGKANLYIILILAFKENEINCLKQCFYEIDLNSIGQELEDEENHKRFKVIHSTKIIL